MSTNYYNAFVAKLKEIFMMDHAELDFGIYRIMNQKRHDIMQFLEHDLLPQVKKVLEGDGANDTASFIARMKEIEQQAASFGASADANPEYQQLKQRLESAADTAALQNDVFSHLVTFFSRYYDNGDFISKRRYKDNTYAIPYNGEEVKLHWANADQYYIKSSEYFRDYSFVLPASRRKVHFVLKDASTEQNNNKAANNMERRFALFASTSSASDGEPFLEVNADGLNIYFTYELMPKATKQDVLLAEALAAIRPAVPEAFAELLTTKAPTAKDANRTLLEKHLTDYTAKNSFDYFIHKDLGGFLRRELDFYIKNEVMHLDDLDAAHIGAQLTIIKAIKQVGEKIILMLAQLEDFQKRLWLKKKFVVQCDYCITLDRVPETLYGEICANDRQREEWVRLFAIDEIKGDLVNVGYSNPLTEEFLKQNPFLVLDTAFFTATFKHKLIASMENIDEQCNGLLINSENFQALELLQEKYKNGIKCVYIDPPYNAKSSEILYKNTFKHASWLSLMENRLSCSNDLLEKESVQIIAIDEVEQVKLSQLLVDLNSEKEVVPVTVLHNPTGQQGYNISFSSEYAIFVYPSFQGRNTLGLETRTDESEWDTRTFRDNSGNSNLRTDAKNCFYPIYVKDNVIVGFGDVCPDSFHPANRNITQEDGTIEIYPIDNNGAEKKWVFERGTVESIESELWIKKISDTEIDIMRTKKKFRFKSCWFDKKYSSNSYGSRLLTEMAIPFSYPKSIYNVLDCLTAGFGEQSNGFVIDYFAGSGTTAHAIINLNKKDNGKRKYILVEVNYYFDNATKSRIEKVIYSSDWRDGKPVSRNGISQCFKYIRLEQYEDTLNNLEVKQRQTAISTNEGFRESYMLSYMLDTETKDSLLNLKMFENPFAMTLKTTKDNELVETPVDMVETFNYLIGLEVETEGWYRDGNICVVIGRTHRDKLRTLVIWRNCNEIGNEALNEFFRHMDFRTRDSEFDVIYVNGDNTLPNLRRDDENWKVVLTEEEFAKRMFEKE